VPLVSKHTRLYEQFRNRRTTPVTVDAATQPGPGGN
jgi:hypothetical protein